MTCSPEAKLLRNIPGGWSPLSSNRPETWTAVTPGHVAGPAEAPGVRSHGGEDVRGDDVQAEPHRGEPGIQAFHT